MVRHCNVLRAAWKALYDACTGDDDPHLWRLAWAEDLVKDLWEKATDSEVPFEDPQAMTEAYGQTKRMFAALRAALTKD